jgi:hypothetical protein
MKLFNARRLMVLSSNMRVLNVLERSKPSAPNTVIGEESILEWLNDLQEVSQVCIDMGLLVSQHAASRLIDSIKGGTRNCKEICTALGHLEETIHDELETHLFMYIEPAKVTYYTTPHLFGEEVTQKFSSSKFDVEEAGKCLALNRGTACIFHLMRVLEVGLYTLSSNLEVNDIQENWQNAIEQIEKSIRALPKTDPRKQPYSEAATHFMHIKDAWRNHTMHIGQIYTDEKAQQIFDSVKAFMQVLATQVGEKSL